MFGNKMYALGAGGHYGLNTINLPLKMSVSA